MAKYNVTFHHKISPTCKCGRPRADHAGTGADFGTGGCVYSGCTAFVLGDVQVADLPSASVEESDKRGVAAMLRDAKLLPRGGRLDSISRSMEGHEKSLALRKLVCFPQASTWHSIVIEPIR